MQFGKKYRDSMDHSRVLVPISLEGKKVQCKVFFNNAFHGFAQAPSNLFNDDGRGYTTYILIPDDVLPAKKLVEEYTQRAPKYSRLIERAMKRRGMHTDD